MFYVYKRGKKTKRFKVIALTVQQSDAEIILDTVEEGYIAKGGEFIKRKGDWS